MWLGKGKNTLPKLWPSTNPSVLERQEYSEHYIFTRPVPACWWMHPIEAVFQEKETGTGLEEQPASFSVLQAPEAGEHVFPHLCAGAFLGAGPQQSRVSTVMPKIFKINFWTQCLTKNALLFWSYHWKCADRCQTVWWTTHMSVLPTKGYRSKPGVGWISWSLFTDQGAENCIGESKQPRHLTLLAHIIFFFI